MPQTARADESLVDEGVGQEDESDGQGESERVLGEEVGPVRTGQIGVGCRDAVGRGGVAVIAPMLREGPALQERVEEVVRRCLAVFGGSGSVRGTVTVRRRDTCSSGDIYEGA